MAADALPLFFAEQDYVGGIVGAGDGESFAIGRPLKLGDVIGGEMRQLVSG